MRAESLGRCCRVAPRTSRTSFAWRKGIKSSQLGSRMFWEVQVCLDSGRQSPARLTLPLNRSPKLSDRLSVKKRCEVCGGHVGPLDDQNKFGCCEKCGIVYALRTTSREQSGDEASSGFGGFERKATETTRFGRPEVIDVEERPQARVFSWRCPDCDAELASTSDTDLEFAEREHVREYHPNRPTK